MLFWNSYPFVRFTVILILGIISYDDYQELWIQSTISIIILIIVFLVFFFVSQKTGFYTLRYVNGFFALLIFFVLGGHLVKYYYHSLPKNHYLSQAKNIKSFSGIITSNRIYSGLNKIKINTLQLQKTKNGAIRYGVIANQKIIIFDSTTYHLDFLYPIQPDIIWINNQSVKSLKWLQQKVKGNIIIFGDGNGYHYLKQMQKSADQLGILVHSLSQKGALFYHLSHQNKLKYIQIGNERIRNKCFN